MIELAVKYSSAQPEEDVADAYARNLKGTMEVWSQIRLDDASTDYSPQRGRTEELAPSGIEAVVASPSEISRSALRPDAVSLHALQEWEGYVTAIRDDTFVAELVDITAREGVPEEQVELPISDLDDDQVASLREGAVFRWVIGYERKNSGTKKRVSHIVFRRLPAWNRRELAQARDLARDLLTGLK